MMNRTIETILEQAGKVHHNLRPEMLIRYAVRQHEGVLADNGALVVNTGKFTGRTPEDRFIVRDSLTETKVHWGKVNQAIAPQRFERLLSKMQAFLVGKTLFARNVVACADEAYRLNARVITTTAFHNLFAYNMFLKPTDDENRHFEASFTVLCVPEFEADPALDGVRSKNFVILNLKERVVLIGGTAYTGEIKKSVFSALNFYLPQHEVLPMHCAANVGAQGDTAVFFGLSGTGKTTLSADPTRQLIGDDEHGWDHKGVFNFEGGCYAKVIDLSAEKEPDIWRAIRLGAMLENVSFVPNTRDVDFSSRAITENTRVSYPIDHIDTVCRGLRAGHPQHIFFLTCDAFGVLPPISKLSIPQAMYYFLSGYTAKVAGTEANVTEPKATFSACFGAPFLPLHPSVYAQMLGQKLAQHPAQVWLINTGWTGGSFGVGKRMHLDYTRSMISAAIDGKLDAVGYTEHPTFGLMMPRSCEGVPAELLNPASTWADAEAYAQQADKLAAMFAQNFEQYESSVADEVLQAGPVALV